jgi:ADP-ribose pyrophosphatase YjhB (NUDIX family)
MTLRRDSFCSTCGTAYAPPLLYPRRCTQCGTQVWANPIPVAVALVSVRLSASETGLLVLRRGIEPGAGKLALPGGFVEDHETWQQAAAREVLEETGVIIDAATLQPFGYTSTSPRPNRVLLFALAAPIDVDALAPFVASAEAQERGVVRGPVGLDDVFAFPLHADAARRYFSAEQQRGHHDFRPA